MKNGLSMLKNVKIFLILSVLLQACSSLGMGRKCPCEDIILPPKPPSDFCLYLSNGRAYCAATDTVIEPIGMICREPKQDDAIWVWIQTAIDAVRN